MDKSHRISCFIGLQFTETDCRGISDLLEKEESERVERSKGVSGLSSLGFLQLFPSLGVPRPCFRDVVNVRLGVLLLHSGDQKT